MRFFYTVLLSCLVFDLYALSPQQACLINEGRRLIGLRETPGRPNRGPELDRLVLSIGGKPGLPWCGYFMMALHKRCGLPMAGGMAMSWFTAPRKVRQPVPADVFSIWNRYMKRIGHVGLIESVSPSGNVIITIEGNTNSMGNREGSGVCRLTRPMKSIYSYARWWK